MYFLCQSLLKRDLKRYEYVYINLGTFKTVKLNQNLWLRVKNTKIECFGQKRHWHVAKKRQLFRGLGAFSKFWLFLYIQSAQFLLCPFRLSKFLARPIPSCWVSLAKSIYANSENIHLVHLFLFQGLFSSYNRSNF